MLKVNSSLFLNAVSPAVYTDNLSSNDNLDLVLPIRIRNN